MIFCAIGNKNIEIFLKVAWEKGKKIVARILPDVKAIEKCLNLGLRPKEIVAMQGPFSEELNRAMLKEYNASVLVTKESGAVGGLETKVNAALSLNIPVVIIERPKLQYNMVVQNYEDLIKFLKG